MDKSLEMDKFYYMCKIYSTLQKSKPPNAPNDSTWLLCTERFHTLAVRASASAHATKQGKPLFNSLKRGAHGINGKCMILWKEVSAVQCTCAWELQSYSLSYCLLGCWQKIDHSSSSLYNFYSCFVFFYFESPIFCRMTGIPPLLQYTLNVDVFELGNRWQRRQKSHNSI